MNLITHNNLTMSSKEIAELTGKLHKNVLADIRNMLDELGSAEKLADYKDAANRTYPMLLLDKEEALCLVSGYNIKMRMAIIKRWNELEAQNKGPALPNFNDPIEAARAWADSQESAKKSEQILLESAPKIAFADQYECSEGEYGFRQACKHLGANEKEFKEFLIAKEIMYSLGKRLTPYAVHTHAGRFKFVVKFETGNKSYSEPKFTPKGIVWISHLWRNRNKKRTKADNRVIRDLLEEIKERL